ncbi:MAG TPA: HisA/HisF-related TIM barrel protein, partial [Victivallales bacterium]|nr:HisA/HisF-related TIM barrel protein [Victivallales bacterium]
YVNSDPVLCKRLEDIGVQCVMPLGSLIGSNQGLKTEYMLRIIIEQSNVPVIIDAGIGSPADAAAAVELGADAVLVNTAVAATENPKLMAEAFRLAVESAQKGIDAGPSEKSSLAFPTSPFETPI